MVAVSNPGSLLGRGPCSFRFAWLAQRILAWTLLRWTGVFDHETQRMRRVEATGSGVASRVSPSISALHAMRRASATAPPESPGPDPDADVLALVGGDTGAALQRLMQRHGHAVYRYCRSALGDAVLAEDIHQQVFIEAFCDLPGFAGRSTLRTWLFGIVRHRVLDAAKHQRQARAHLDVAAGADLPDPTPSPSEGLDDAQLLATVVTCLAALDEPVRTAVLLRYQQGLTYEEMAEICGEKAGTLQVRVSRTLRKLRDRLESLVAQ
jgi:RNA polymerase sigma-70 factor (ECF subfamily)